MSEPLNAKKSTKPTSLAVPASVKMKLSIARIAIVGTINTGESRIS
jgi:hypothetical protein